MTQRLIIVAGGPNSGKMPLARKLIEASPELILVHRDDIRRDLGGNGSIDEGVITYIMGDMTRRLLDNGHSVIVVAWNLEQMDQDLWLRLSREAKIPFTWMDVRTPEIAALIPPKSSN